MKALMTADTVGGVWTYAIELSRALAKFDCEIALVALGDPLSNDQAAAVDAIENVTVHECPGRLEWMTDPWEDVRRSQDFVRELARSVAPDVVHANSYCHAAMERDEPTLLVAHSCVVSWFEAVRLGPPGAEWVTYRAVIREALDRADLIVAPTTRVLEALERGYGGFDHGFAIHNGIGTSADASTIGGRAGVEFLDGADRRRNVFAAGRMWDEAKNLAALARAAGRIDAPMRVAGLSHPDGSDGKRDGVTFLGPLDRTAMRREYRQAAVFAHPAKYEPFGLTPLEAAREGCVLVLGDIPTLREVWGDAATFVPPDDDRALSHAIGELLDDEPARQELVRRSVARAAELNADRMAASYHDAYRRLVRTRTCQEVR